MAKRLLIVDQNLLRKPLLETLLVDDPDLQVVLPDMAFLEMTKAPEWEETVRASLAILARYERRVHVCKSVNEALGDEVASLNSATGRMMFPEATKFVRDLLKTVRTGIDGDSIARMRANPDNHLQDLASQHLNHDDNKERILGLIEGTSTVIPDEAKKRMRSKKMDGDETLDIVYQIGTSMLPEVLAPRGWSEAQAIAFRRKKPMVLRYLYLKAWRCVRWLADGGIEAREPKAVTNDELDDQYILSATCFSGLLSLENSVNFAYRDLRALLAREA
jgi:hypothetical protein